MPKTFNQTAAIRGALRRIFSRSPVIWEVMQAVRREIPKYNNDGSRSKKDAVQYQCSACLKFVGSTKVSVDHRDPVIPIEQEKEEMDWNAFIVRLFCSKENLSVMCDDCHQSKSNAERIARLCFQYGREMDNIEERINLSDCTDEDRKRLTNLMGKKKPLGLVGVAQRACELREKWARMRN